MILDSIALYPLKPAVWCFRLQHFNVDWEVDMMRWRWSDGCDEYIWYLVHDKIAILYLETLGRYSIYVRDVAWGMSLKSWLQRRRATNRISCSVSWPLYELAVIPEQWMCLDLLLVESHIKNLADSVADTWLLSEKIPFMLLDQLGKPFDNTLSGRHVSVQVQKAGSWLLCQY